MKKIRIITNWICIAMFVAYVALLAVKWAQLPDQIPVHFDAAGASDKYGGKGSLLIYPVIAAAVFGMVAVAERIPSLWSLPVTVTEANRDRVYRITTLMLGCVKIIVTAMLLYSGFGCMMGIGALWPVLVMAGLMLAVIFVSILALAWTK